MNRRVILAGLGATLAGPALARAPDTAIRPALRRGAVSAAQVTEVSALIEAAGLGGKVAYAVADARSGALLETRSHLAALPPASVTKAVTAHYALERLGPGYRFRTRLIATGPLVRGRIEGDLVLEASGDPTLDSDDLGAMAEALKAAGVATVQGRFLVVPAGIPETAAIDHGQPDHVAYNPGVAGLNLNLNRVHFEWLRAGSDYTFTLEARSGRYRPATTTSAMEIVERPAPVYDYVHSGGVDRWSVAKSALGAKGARWLPVRRPVAYALDALMSVMRSQGISLPAPQIAARAPGGLVLYEAVSPPMADVLRRMLDRSTNLTAEVVGQTATLARGGSLQTLRASASEMATWLRRETKARRPRFVDHSGLGEANDLTPRDMVAALNFAGPSGALAGLMKPWYYRNSQGVYDRASPIRLAAKTGTLNFVSGLAGFVLPPGGRALAFAVFAADEDRRRTIPRAAREKVPGARSWGRRARVLQDKLLKRWTALYA